MLQTHELTGTAYQFTINRLIEAKSKIVFMILTYLFILGGRTGLVVRASDSGSGDPGVILGQVGVLFP